MKRTDRRRSGGGLMAEYRVVLWYPRQAGFQIDVSADGVDMARRLAEDAARSCGWEGRVRKIEIVPVRRQRGEA